MLLTRIQRDNLFLIATACLLALGICAPFSGHDLQRGTQICLGLCAVLYGLSVSSREGSVNRPAAAGLALIMVLGLVSSVLAHQPLWALTEMALFICSAATALAVTSLRRHGGESIDSALMLIVLMLCVIKSVQYGYALILAFGSGQRLLNLDLLLSGFSNKRFYGQFQTFTLPLLALSLLIPKVSRPARAAALVLLCVWWLIAISGGTRGTWLGMAVAAAVLVWLGPSGRRWVAWQLAGVCGGLLLYGCLFMLLAHHSGNEIVSAAGERLTTSLSGRGPIWWQGWHMIAERPWLGFGPMHFADVANPIAAHPHQAVLQWASEWGVPSALCVAVLAGWGGWATVGLIRERAMVATRADLLRLCLFAALVGALTQSMVDGVIVMPNSQVWLALVVGWLMALHVRRAPEPPALPLAAGAWRMTSVLAVGLLVYVVIRDVPHLEHARQVYLDGRGDHLQPRFWAQGVIALPRP